MSEPIAQEDLERAREALAHQVAAAVHWALAARKMTVAELKLKLHDVDPDLIDAVLFAENSAVVGLNLLADIAYVCGFDWQFSVRRLADEPDAALPATRDMEASNG
jgi:hypothetical protein